jgi:hypothetical protein
MAGTGTATTEAATDPVGTEGTMTWQNCGAGSRCSHKNSRTGELANSYQGRPGGAVKTAANRELGGKMYHPGCFPKKADTEAILASDPRPKVDGITLRQVRHGDTETQAEASWDRVLKARQKAREATKKATPKKATKKA